MSRIRALRHTAYSALAGNVAARVGALASVFVATLLLAHHGGPAVVGVYALLHVLPGLVGTIVSSGLTVSVPYFLAGPYRDDRRLPLTLITIAVGSGLAGAALWAAGSPLFGPVLFKHVPLGLVALAGVAVLTRLITITAKSCSQGSDDLFGANRVIFTEEFMFLPAYGAVWAAGARGYAAVVLALLAADAATAAIGWARLIRRRFFADVAPPSRELARKVAAYGLRAQTGGLISQLNLRLDFVVLTVLAGPAVLGVYAIASKFAELIKLVGMALTYVLYPEYARDGLARAAARARKLIPKAGSLTAAIAVPLALSAGFVIPAFYGADFDSAVTPARIILLGLVFEGMGGVITGFLYGVGRPGLNSWAMAAGLVATVILDLALIPAFGATGAAVASAVAYTTSTVTLLWFFSRVVRPQPTIKWEEANLPEAAAVR